MMRALGGLAGALACAASLAAQAGDAKDRPGTRQDPPAGYPIPDAPPLSPEEARAAFVVAPGLKVELAAAEPLVVAPVAMQFDAGGRLWVVEMRSFMPDADGTGETRPDGEVAVLEDRDGDGIFDRRTTFLSGLVLPRAVCPLRGAALVLAPPRLLLCPDRDGDLRADATIEVDAGLGGIDNPEHAPNGLLWALDNRIYLARHDACYTLAGGRVVRHPSPALGQWGIAQDDVGRLFYNDNSTHLRADLVPRQLAAANPHAGRAPGLDHVCCRDQSVWPVRVTPGVNRGYQEGVLDGGRLKRFTAACSPLVYRGTLLAGLRGAALVCEPAGNLVRAARVHEVDGVLHAEPIARGAEVLASHDERFRPVALAEGLDGAVYVADMARGVIQHRLFLTTFLRRQIEARGLEAPLDRGRIWRLVPEGGYVPGRKLAQAEWPELVDALADPSGAVRDHAQRQLVWRAETRAVPRLEALVTGGAMPAALHALWCLAGMGTLARGVLLDAVFARDPAVRAGAYEIAAGVLAERRDTLLAAALVRCAAEEDDARTARVLALVLGRAAVPGMPAAVVDLVERRAGDAMTADCAVVGIAGRELDVCREVVGGGRQGAAALALLRAAATVIARRGRAEEVAALDELARAARVPEHAQALDAGAAGVAAAARARPASRLPDDPQARARIERGKGLFVVCAGCHGMKGEGTGEAPPLVGSGRLGGPAEVAIRIVLFGSQGERSMPALALGDEDVAAVLSYARHAFAGASVVEPGEVRALR